MKTLRMSILSLSALILLISAAEATAGDVKVRGRISIRTPEVSVTVGHRDGARKVLRKRTGREASRRYRHLSKGDQARAARLAVYTGISRVKFMELRLRGYSWRRIAHRLDLPVRLVRAARTAESWRDFRRPHIRRCVNG